MFKKVKNILNNSYKSTVCISVITLLVTHISMAQVTFYSNPEPIHELNSADAESNLYLTADGSRLVFTKEKSLLNVGGKSNPGDIWFSNLHKKETDTALARAFNDQNLFSSPLGYTPDGKYFLFSTVSTEYGVHTGKVMRYSIGSKQKFEEEIPHFVNTSGQQSGYLSRDGKYLLISAERSSGYGVEDLYVCFANGDGSWTEPRNLGYKVNTDMQEITPFLSDDNKTLYFSTNARDGFGSFDLYVTRRLDDTWRNWSEPVNLGGVINSIGSETSFMFNQGDEYGYFISTQNSDGYGDIKRIRIFPTPEGEEKDSVKQNVEMLSETINLTFLVQNVRTEEPLDFQYIGKQYVSGVANSLNSFGNTVPGMQLTLADEDSIDIEFKARGYLSESILLRASEKESDTILIGLEPLETGNVIVLKHVLFHRSTADFIESSKRELDLVLEMMLDNPDVKIFLKGHTDNTGNKALNVALSRARVMAVKDYLVNRGVSPNRVSGKGFGGEKPIASNDQEETRKLNRRVEFEVLRD